MVRASAVSHPDSVNEDCCLCLEDASSFVKDGNGTALVVRHEGEA
jgi:hypothetical protein